MLLGVVLGILIGTIAGCLLCVRYLRREIAADIGPNLQRIQRQLGNVELQLDDLERAVNLNQVTLRAEMAACLAPLPQVSPPLPQPPLPRSSRPTFAA